MTITLLVNKVKFHIHHADHGITFEQMGYICEKFPLTHTVASLIIEQIELPSKYGTVPCSLIGPAMGDDAVEDKDCFIAPRGERKYDDRMHNTARPRQVDYVQCIGATRWVPALSEPGTSYLEVDVYTVHGGPLAPQNPCDPTCKDVEASTKFWAQHALSQHTMLED